MKLKLHWAEKYEVVREFPSFVLDSKKFPELELEMLQVYNAGSLDERDSALDQLEYKMHHTETGERGETIFQMVGPYEKDKYDQSVVHTLDDESNGCFRLDEVQ